MWMLDMKKYQAIQHQRRRLNVIFGNGLRQLGLRGENNPVKGRARSLIYSGSKLRSSRNISRTPRPIQENFAEQARLLERNFQNMLENRLPGERPDRHPASGTWERTSPRFRRDRSRRDACPTVRPRCFGVRPGFSGSEIAEQLRGVDLACFCPTRPPSGEFCGQTAGADFPGMLKIDCRVNLINCLPRSIPARWRSSIDGCSTFWRISGDQHNRRRPNVIFGNGLRKLGVREEIIP